ncbi:adipocyte plasma membrane-associated protein-like [Stegastes partitus]|uniref:Adipocyte plasma membrane-associated protein-like n=1 Tax=Stegastes partitus TaxID=144197 RepID=A0A9Y4NFY9_9TELE|nr:PREDICTED: adipocyte plasma membrane-associated protein-like [Stegastes partitus]
MNEAAGLRFRRLHRPTVITDELPELRYKGAGTYSSKVFQVTLVSLGGFLLLPLLVIILILESPIQPEVFRSAACPSRALQVLNVAAEIHSAQTQKAVCVPEDKTRPSSEQNTKT